MCEMTSFFQQAVADKLKAELEASRKVEANPPKPPKRQKKAKEEKEEEEEQVIVLTKTTSKGIVRPLGEEGLAPSGEGVASRQRTEPKYICRVGILQPFDISVE